MTAPPEASSATPASAERVHAFRLVLGAFLVAAFYSLDRTSNSIRVSFHPPWDRSAPGELYFWLGAITFLLPGTCLLGAAFETQVVRACVGLVERLRAATRDERLGMTGLVLFVGFIVSYVGNEGFLRGMPITDDEGAARFGGQILATGHAMVRLPPLRAAFEDLFLFQHHGRWTSMDFPGALLPWTIGELTRSGTLVFRIASACTPFGVYLAVRRRHGLVDGLVAAALVLLSPSGHLVSMTNHTHVVSRCGIALGLGALLFRATPTLRVGAAAGAAFGLAFLARPAETVALVAPLALLFAFRARTDPAHRRAISGLVLGALPFVVSFFAYDLAVTGSLSMPRSVPNEIVHPYGRALHGAFEFALWPARFGYNLGYNLLTTSVFFLGPLGVALVAFGARASSVHRALVAGVGLQFGLALLHDDRGLHLVGPIHYAEVVVPLAIVATSGLRRARQFLVEHAFDVRPFAAATVGYLALGLPLFVVWHASALAGQTAHLESTIELASRVESSPAVVLVPPLAVVRNNDIVHRSSGSFVFSWPRPSPTLDEPVIFLADSPLARAGVRTAFPDRTPYVLQRPQHVFVPIPLAIVESAAPQAP